MGKIIFMLLIAAITWVLFKKHTKPPSGSGSNGNGRQEAADATSVPTAKARAGNKDSSAWMSERMVACSACGVFMPESDSVRLNDIVSCRDPVSCAHRPKFDAK